NAQWQPGSRPTGVSGRYGSHLFRAQGRVSCGRVSAPATITLAGRRPLGFLSTENRMLESEKLKTLQLTRRRREARAWRASEYRGSICRASWKQRMALEYISLPR